MTEKAIDSMQLTDEEKTIYQWQMTVPGFGESGQKKLKAARALISRCGGLGGPLAYNLASAGIGKLVIAHAGNVRLSDLNRQILMTYAWLDKPRVESVQRRLKEYHPCLEIEAVPENINEENVSELVSKVDIVFDCAPMFNERFLMNRECVRQGKPLIDAAMYCLEGQVMTILPGRSACLACLYPEMPDQWQRQFPVFGAVAAVAAALAAMEGIKLLAGFGENLTGALLHYDCLNMSFQRIKINRRADCAVCAGV